MSASPLSPIQDPRSTLAAPGRAEQPAAAPRQWRLRLDPLLLLAVVGLCACSVVAIRTATRDDIPGQPLYYVERQLAYVVVGLLLMYGISRMDYSRLRELKYAVYGSMIGSIALVYLFATATRGSKRWIDLPFFRFQPSELGKVLFVIAVAAFVVDRSRRLNDRRTTARILLLALAPVMLVMAQPDLGTSLVYVVGTVALLFVAGVPMRHFAALGGLGAAAVALALFGLPKVGIQVLEPYQLDRLTSFLHPSGVAGEEGYQQQQSLIAIGSGEKTGRGPEQATQTTLNFLPEHHTDFIFSVIGETYGFAGAALVLSLYALLIWRGLHILTVAKNLYGALIAGGITVMFLFQVFVNIGMTVGIMPITGVPAPLLSYGGSSMLVTFLAIGLLQSIYAQARETGASKTRGTSLFQG